jgi:hypothetical protein
MRGVRALAISISAATAAAAAVTVSQAGAADAAGHAGSVPSGFIGVNADQSALSPNVNLLAQLRLMRASGAPRMRIQFSWKLAQPYASWKDVPPSQASQFTTGPGGVPTDFQGTDLVVGAAALRGISLTPVVLYAPGWDASPKGNHAQPVRDGPYGQYLSALVKRYGPDGTFWKSNPKLPRDPIVRWQVWNEPELGYFWDTQPFARSYVALLRVAHHAIKAADPSATVLLAALTNHSWDDLRSIYKVHGSRGLFSDVAVDPYTRSARGVITILSYVRQVMNQYGDGRKPLIATEVGWPAAAGKTKIQFGFDTTEKEATVRLSQLMPLLASNRKKLHLGGYYYYTWMSSFNSHSSTPFAFSGLLRLHQDHVCAEPVFSVFRQDSLSEQGRSAKGQTPRKCSG